AAKSLVAESMADPGLYYRNNVAGGVALLEAMKGAGVTRLVFSSTAAVYGEPRRVPIAEADRTDPINPYGATKLAFEGAMRWSAAGFSVREVVEAARKVTGRSIPARALKRRVGDPPVLVASSRRARRELGWTPRHSSLEQMLTDAWGWRLAHPRGYDDRVADERERASGSDGHERGVAASVAVS